MKIQFLVLSEFHLGRYYSTKYCKTQLYKGGVIGTTVGKRVMVSGIYLEVVSIKERGLEEASHFISKFFFQNIHLMYMNTLIQENTHESNNSQ